MLPSKKQYNVNKNLDYEILVFHCPGHIFVTPLCSDNARNLNVNIKQNKYIIKQ